MKQSKKSYVFTEKKSFFFKYIILYEKNTSKENYAQKSIDTKTVENSILIDTSRLSSSLKHSNIKK